MKSSADLKETCRFFKHCLKFKRNFFSSNNNFGMTLASQVRIGAVIKRMLEKN